MSVKTTTMGAVFMNVSTYLATTGAPAMMDSCWPTTDTTVWVRTFLNTFVFYVCVSVNTVGGLDG